MLSIRADAIHIVPAASALGALAGLHREAIGLTVCPFFKRDRTHDHDKAQLVAERGERIVILTRGHNVSDGLK